MSTQPLGALAIGVIVDVVPAIGGRVAIVARDGATWRRGVRLVISCESAREMALELLQAADDASSNDGYPVLILEEEAC